MDKATIEYHLQTVITDRDVQPVGHRQYMQSMTRAIKIASIKEGMKGLPLTKADIDRIVKALKN